MVPPCERGKVQCQSEEYGNISLSYSFCRPRTTPIILLHGMVSTMETWMNIATLLANEAKTKVYMYDARNHGESAYLDKFDFDVNVDDLFNFMDSLHIKKAILVGHKMGAQTAFRAAFKSPDRVEAVISEDTYVHKLQKSDFVGCLTFVERLDRHVNEVPPNLSPIEAAKHLFDVLARRYTDDVSFIAEKDFLANSRFVLKKKDDGEWKVSFNKNVVVNLLLNAETLVTNAIGTYDKDALFLCGGNSSYKVFEHEDVIKVHFPKAKIVVMENSRHYPHSDDPDSFIQEIVKFLNAREILTKLVSDE